jgi:hypothetical protein
MTSTNSPCPGHSDLLELAARRSSWRRRLRTAALATRAWWLFVRLDRRIARGRFDARSLAPAGPPRQGAPTARERSEDTWAAVQAATRWYYRRQQDCLPKAVTTFELLRRQGLPARLCFGVRKFPFAAHSWVEASGLVLDDDPPRVAFYQVIHDLHA